MSTDIKHCIFYLFDRNVLRKKSEVAREKLLM